MAELSKLVLPVMDTSTGTITDQEFDIGGGGSAELESRVEALEDDVPFPLKKSGDAYGYENDNGDFVAFKSQADIDSAVAAAKVGTAVAGDVLSGKTFTNSTTSGVNGAMANNGAVSQALNCGGSYTVPAGYHNGSGTVTANSLASQTPVDSGKTPVTAGAMLTGYQGWVNGSKVTGTMANNGAVSQSLNTSTTSYTVPAGYHNGSGKVSITTQTKTSTPTTRSATADTVYPDSGKVLSAVTVNTNSVPNSNSGVKTITSSDANWLTGNVDMGAANSYRYVNAVNVYNKGKTDGVSSANNYLRFDGIGTNAANFTGLTVGAYIICYAGSTSSTTTYRPTVTTGLTFISEKIIGPYPGVSTWPYTYMAIYRIDSASIIFGTGLPGVGLSWFEIA